MSEEQECNQVLKGLCNCKCVENGTYPCFIEKEFLLKQELKTAKEENEKLKEDKITKDDLRRELNYQCEVVERLKEEMELAPLCVQSCNVDCEIKQLREKNSTLTQQNKQMRDFLSSLDKCPSDECNVDCLNQAIDRNCLYANIKQALKGGE